ATGLSQATTLQFQAGSTSTITTLSLSGLSLNSPVYLRSTTNSTSWGIKNTGTESVSFVDVRDSSASFAGGNTIYASNSRDSGNNQNWNFGVFTWLGGTSSNWSTASNWDANAVPGTNDAAIIPASVTSFYPTLTQTINVATVTVQSGSQL